MYSRQTDNLRSILLSVHNRKNAGNNIYIAKTSKKVLTNAEEFAIISPVEAVLCNGSTTDSDSVCWGSNPYTAGKPKTLKVLSFGVFSFEYGSKYLPKKKQNCNFSVNPCTILLFCCFNNITIIETDHVHRHILHPAGIFVSKTMPVSTWFKSISTQKSLHH